MRWTALLEKASPKLSTPVPFAGPLDAGRQWLLAAIIEKSEPERDRTEQMPDGVPLQQAVWGAQLTALVEIPDRESDDIGDQAGKIITGPDLRAARSGKDKLKEDGGEENNRKQPSANLW